MYIIMNITCLVNYLKCVETLAAQKINAYKVHIISCVFTKTVCETLTIFIYNVKVIHLVFIDGSQTLQIRFNAAIFPLNHFEGLL